MKCRQRLYLTADRKKVVPEGDKKAASLYAVPGDEIPQSAHDLFGLVDGHLKGFDPDADAKVEEKEPEPPQPTVAATQVLHHSTEAPDMLVPADDPAAGKLYANVGDLIPQSAHDGFGLVDGALPVTPPADGKENGGGSNKEQKGGSDKEQKSGADKEVRPDGDKTAASAGAQGADQGTAVGGDA